MRPLDVRFVLRVWQDGRPGEALRASLRELATGSLHQFGDLDELRRHLGSLDAAAADGDDEPTVDARA